MINKNECRESIESQFYKLENVYYNIYKHFRV